MQPIRVIIPGDFWDSQIYRGRLYLWNMAGSLAVYSWDDLVESLCSDDTRLALTCGLSRGDYLYGPEFQVVFDDRDVRGLLETKFQQAGTSALELRLSDMQRCLIKEVTTPFDILHDDCDIYGNHIFALTEKGLHSVKIEHARRKGPVTQKEKLWGGQGSSVRAKGSFLAVAAGADGLFEGAAFRESLSGDSEEMKLVSERHTLFANWAFASIFGSSDIGDSYLAAYSWERPTRRSSSDEAFAPRFVRHFEGVIDDAQIFGARGLAWGSDDKFYSVGSGRLDVVRFTQKYLTADDRTDAFEHLQAIELAPWNGDVVAGGVAFFGAIVELENAVIIVGSNDESEIIPGPISRWRVFPRSKRYENHLHLIYNDHLEIRSYNHDYFVNQRDKRAGIEHRADRYAKR